MRTAGRSSMLVVPEFRTASKPARRRRALWSAPAARLRGVPPVRGRNESRTIARYWKPATPARRSGPTPTRTSRCAAAFCTWRRSWTGRLGGCSPGGRRTRSTHRSASKRWRRPCGATGSPRSSTRTRRQPVHLGGLRRRARERQGQNGDGRPGPLPREHVHRAPGRSLKHAAVYLRQLTSDLEARGILGGWMAFYNDQRPHAGLGGRTPAEAHGGLIGIPENREPSTAPTT